MEYIIERLQKAGLRLEEYDERGKVIPFSRAHPAT
jgi:hypothetical protein